ncbi:type I glyceraldehyde-3-phosphate dehydrogenase [Escherichia coli]
MTIKVGINGFGRIGRFVFRLAAERADIEVVGINDLIDVDYMAYMLKYDSTHGRFKGTVEVKDGNLIVNGKTVRVTAERDPANLKWGEIGVDVVAERNRSVPDRRNRSKRHRRRCQESRTDRSVKTPPRCSSWASTTTPYAGQDIVSNASCTTNCLAPIAKVLNDTFGIESGLMTTVHATTATQKTVDGPSAKDWRGGRGASEHHPVLYRCCQGCWRGLPELNGKLTGIAFRVPTPDVSVVDLTVNLKKEASYVMIRP